MLRSTHQIQAPPLGLSPAPLPPGWTEHKAPTGHSYYYNAETKQSTYTRPTAQPQLHPIPTPIAAGYAAHGFPPALARGYNPAAHLSPHQPPFQPGHRGRGGSRGGHGYQDRKRQHPPDRPKHKHAIPGCAPWVLVKTKLGRRFVHNTETNESFWKFPEDVMKGVVEFDRVERERRERRERGEASDVEDEEAAAAEEVAAAQADGRAPAQPGRIVQAADGEDGASDEYEEVEVTDDEEEEDEDNPSKRQRTAEAPRDQPLEFNEDDIAYQLATMGQDYGLDPGEYGVGDEDGDGQWEEGAEGLPLTEEDSQALFRDLLDDHHINPYSTWEKTIEEGRIIDDDRYTALPTMKARRETWDAWSRAKIAALKAQREQQARLDPRIPYLAFLQQHASPKLYWPEFKRKHRKAPEMRDSALSDKDREKAYREHVARTTKLPQTALQADLRALLASVPLPALNRDTALAALPPALLTDLRYISLPASVRDPIIEAHIATLAPVPESAGLSGADEEEASARRRERERREKALAERERRVAEEKRRQRRDVEVGRGRLREEERELDRAMRVGKEGLRGQIGAIGGKGEEESEKRRDVEMGA